MFFSFRSFLQLALRQVITPKQDLLSRGCSATKLAQRLTSPEETQPQPTIAFKQLKGQRKLTYSTATAFQWAAQRQCPVEPCASQLAIALQSTLEQVQHPFFPQGDHPKYLLHLLPQDLTVEWSTTGLIQVQVSDRAIAAWLDHLLQPLAPHQRSLITPPVNLTLHAQFGLQHAHARCCSLLRLAHHAQIITLSAIDEHPQYWQFTAPTPLSWLTPTDQLQPSSDRLLLNQLITLVDDLDNLTAQGSQSSLLSLAASFSQTFDQFHRTHPMGGRSATAITSPSNLRQFGLLMATQRILQSLLEDYLSLHAPTEL